MKALGTQNVDLIMKNCTRWVLEYSLKDEALEDLEFSVFVKLIYRNYVCNTHCFSKLHQQRWTADELVINMKKWRNKPSVLAPENIELTRNHCADYDEILQK